MVYHNGMTVNYRFVHEAVQSLLDNVAREADSLTRLQTIQELNAEWRRLMIPARDEAAYDARGQYAREDLQVLTGYDNSQIAYWAKRHRARSGAPALRRIDRVDLSGAVDLRHRTVDPQ